MNTPTSKPADKNRNIPVYLTPEQIHEEEVMLLARTDRGPIPERDWFIADDIIPDLL